MEQLPEIQGRPRPLQPAILVVHRPEDFTTPMDKVVYGTLGDPITPDYVRDMNDLEQKRREILKRQNESRKWAKSWMATLLKLKTRLNVQETWRRSTLLSSRSR
jgi:hypothetical protein